MNNARAGLRKQSQSQRRYITGFDGLRTFGVIGVLLYHLQPRLFKGGYLGVPIFMLVSGYLITDGLLMEYDRHGRINFKHFFTRRFKRLYPALLAMLSATAGYIALFQRQLLGNLHKIVAANLVYLYNWWQILNVQSYFARFANGESPFTHLWTLSIEGQFYLIWPFIVLLFLVLLKKKRNVMFSITLILALISGVWMFTLYNPGSAGQAFDPSRLYYGTDTRTFSILLGAALAFIWPSSELPDRIPKRGTAILDLVGLGAAAGMLIMTSTVDSTSAFLYRGGMFLFSILATLLVAVVAHPGAHWNQILSNPVFSWIGSRSYGLYLYQFPVIIFWENAFKNTADHPVLYPVLEILITVLVAEVSYRCIEQPIAHFDFGKTVDYFKALLNLKSGMKPGRRVISYLSIMVLAFGSSGVIKAFGVEADAADRSELAMQLEQNAKEETAASKEPDEPAPISPPNPQSTQDEPTIDPAFDAKYTKYKPYGMTMTQLVTAQNLAVTGIGDSVMLDAKPDLQEIFPNAVINAAISRQIGQGIDLAKKMANNGTLAKVVLIGLGSNGPVSPKQIFQFMQIVGPSREVFWVNIKVPDAWEHDVNATLRAEQSKYPNLTVIDWYTYSKPHGDWFWADGTHPSPKGNPYYATLIAKTITDSLQ